MRIKKSKIIEKVVEPDFSEDTGKPEQSATNCIHQSLSETSNGRTMCNHCGLITKE